MGKINANEKIIKAYWELSKIGKLSVSNICKKAQINRSTFYQYYLDIVELSNKEENRIVDEIIKNLEVKFPNQMPSDINEFPKIIIEIFTKYGDYITILLNNNSSNFQAKITKELTKKAQTNLDVAADNVYIKYLIAFMTSNVCSLLKCWYDNNKDLSMEELLTFTHNLIFNGLLNYKEKQL